MSALILLVFLPVNILLAFTILYSNPKSWTNRFFSLLIILLSLCFALNARINAVESIDIKLIIYRSIYFLGAFTNLTIFLFLSTFPHSRIQTAKKTIIFALGTTFLVAFFTMTGLIFTDTVRFDNSQFPGLGVLTPFYIIHSILLISGGFLTLFLHYKQSKSVDRNRIRFVFISFFLPFIIIIAVNLTFSVILKTDTLTPLLPIYLLFFNILISYSIFKYRLIDIRIFITKIISFAVLFFLSTIIYYGLFSAFSSLILYNHDKNTALFVSLALTLTIAFSFQPIRKALQKITDKTFFKDHYDTRDLLYELTLVMTSSKKLEQLCHDLLKTLLNRMRVKKGAFFLIRKNRIYQIAHEGYEENPELDEKRLEELLEQNRIITLNDDNNGTIIDALEHLQISLALPLFSEGQKVGMLGLGEKISGDIYNYDDIKLLSILAPEAAVAIQNAVSFEEIQRFNITLQDEVRKATYNLEQANERLRSLDKLKDEFISFTSHELRTPLTAIKSYVWMVLNDQDAKLNDKIKNYLTKVYRSNERLIRLVNDMLNVSRIESGRIIIDIKPFKIKDLVNDITDEFHARVLERKMTFKTYIADENLSVIADRSKVQEVLENLVGNALKFTKESGEITLTVSKRTDGMVLFEVKDNGIGIKREDLPRLFNKFEKLTQSFSNMSDSSGTGLGLYICRQYVEINRGKIWAESEAGKGSIFKFVLPSE